MAYCRKKCIYCDFFSAGDRIADWHRYTDALIAELQNRKDEIACPLRTIYVGGGTPSLMPADELVRLTEAIKPFSEQVEEFTIEVNPDDVSPEMLQIWKKVGVNRLSIGIQSFDDNLLASIGRRHDASSARNAYSLARQYFDNISIDLMFGLPGQTVEMWRKDVKEAISLRPEHISAYSLMYEPGTVLTALRDNGRVAEASEDMTETMFRILIEELRTAGYDHYEISNFSLPGFRSRHNSSYWHQIPYIGIGPSAHSYDGMRTRKSNRADLRGYLDYWAPENNMEKKTDTLYEKEILCDEELIEEYIMTRMRTREGIPLDDFKNRFGDDVFEKFIDRCKDIQDKGFLIMNSKNVSLHESAIIISDSIILDLLIFY